MPNYKRKTDRGIIDIDALTKAIKSVKSGNESVRAAAQSFGIDRMTLTRHIAKLDDKITDFSTVSDDDLKKMLTRITSHSANLTVFSFEEEQALVKYVVKSCKLYYGLSIRELRELAYQFAIKMAIDHPSGWDSNHMAGKDWYYRFMKRNSNLSFCALNRVKSFCRENVDNFVGNLNEVLSEHTYSPCAIWNMDETEFSTAPSKIDKVVSSQGMRRVGQMASETGEAMVTMALAVNAAGNSIPPMFLFPRQNMQSTFMENAYPGSIGVANGSGWMQQEEFVTWMEHFIIHSNSSKQRPTLLLLNNHSSHLSIAALDLALVNGVTLLSFPPHYSHRLQPLDVSVYGPVKAYYTRQCNAWLKTNAGRVLEIRHIPGLVKSALMLALVPRTIIKGFKATGISPFNLDVFIEADFVQAEVSGENTTAAKFEAQVTDHVEQRRIFVTAHEEVTESEQSSTSTFRSYSLSSLSQFWQKHQAKNRIEEERRRKAPS